MDQTGTERRRIIRPAQYRKSVVCYRATWEAELNLLYRMFDEDGRLLYVGISTSALTFERLRNHKNGSHFFPLVRTITIEHVSSQEDLRAAEVIAIKNERPVYNKQLNQDRCPRCNRLSGSHSKKCGFATNSLLT